MASSTRPVDFMNYFSAYPEQIKAQVEALINSGKLARYFEKKYPIAHQFKSEKALYDFATGLKQHYLKNAPKLNSVKYEKQKDLVLNALGTHTFKRHAHGKKLKAQHHIAIANQLKYAPEEILKTLVVHELAHFKEKDHNKSFYNLCCHMQPDYFQGELDLRLFMVLCDRGENFYETL
ncbi:M48 family metallopeptidase [Pseudoalteromonas sp. SSM20]|uniref:M48 metallopeptidase family protein n=1 Tax=Pseudoalteromonas sp. SSM20 TaxID=3139394 RepID=UPI003BAB27C4